MCLWELNTTERQHCLVFRRRSPWWPLRATSVPNAVPKLPEPNTTTFTGSIGVLALLPLVSPPPLHPQTRPVRAGWGRGMYDVVLSPRQCVTRVHPSEVDEEHLVSPSMALSPVLCTLVTIHHAVSHPRRRRVDAVCGATRVCGWLASCTHAVGAVPAPQHDEEAQGGAQHGEA